MAARRLTSPPLTLKKNNLLCSAEHLAGTTGGQHKEDKRYISFNVVANSQFPLYLKALIKFR